MIATVKSQPVQAVQWRGGSSLRDVQDVLAPQSPHVESGSIGVSIDVCEIGIDRRLTYVPWGSWIVRDAAGRISVWDEETFARWFTTQE